MPRDASAAIDLLSRVAGVALRQVFAAILLIRRPRPIHSRGVVARGEIRWLGTGVRSGIGWIDEPPASAVSVVARWSRSIGLPRRLPDIQGLALRVDTDGSVADIEFASTGAGVPSRFLLLPHRRPSRAHFNTLFPYRGSDGPRLLGARTVSSSGSSRDAAVPDVTTLRLFFASPVGRWHPFAEVTLFSSTERDDPALRFDAVAHPLPGAGTYGWTRALREPSYRLAQRPTDARAGQRQASA